MNYLSYQNFSETTQNLCTLIAITLFLLICTMIFPQNKYSISVIVGKIISLILLSYIILTMFRETSFFINQNPDLLKDKNLSLLRNNTLFNYLISITLLLLGLYVIYTFFF